MAISTYATATTRFWVGATSSNWNVTTNWNTTSGGGGATGIPAAGDDVIFDGNGLVDCNINLSVTVKSFTVSAGYTKTITQLSGSVLTINTTSSWSGGIFSGSNSNITNTGAFTLSGTAFTNTSATLLIGGNSTWSSGTFNGGSSTISNTGTFTLSGATFTSTSGTLSIGKNFSFTSGSFIHNSGTISFDQTLSATSIAVSNSAALTFNNVISVPNYQTLTFNNAPTINGNFTVNGTAGHTISFSSSLTVNGNFTINSNVSPQTISFSTAAVSVTVNGSLNVTGSLAVSINTGKINAKGDINYTNTNSGTGGSGTINVSGSGTQTLTGSGTINLGSLPNVTINSSGTLNLASYISCIGGSWAYNSGTINGGTSTVAFINTGTAFIVSGTHTLSDVYFLGSYSTFTINNNLTTNNLTFDSNTNGFTATISSSITVNGAFLMQGSVNLQINTGTINAKGDITSTNSSAASGGTATINISGTATQKLTGSGVTGQGSFPNIIINKTGTLNLVSYITCKGTSWTYTAGTISAGTSTVNFYNAGVSTFTISGTQTLNNVVFFGNYAATTHTVSNDLIVNDLTFDASQTCAVAISTFITVNGTLTYYSPTGGGNITLNSGTINVKGNVVNNSLLTSNNGGTAFFIINGTGAQSITGTAAIDQGAYPPFTINKASGTVSFSGFLTFYNGFTWTAGTVNPGTSTCVFINTVATAQNISASGMSFYNVVFEQPDYSRTRLNTDISLLGSFIINASCGVQTNNHNISIGGDFNCLNTNAGSNNAFIPGTGTVTFNGTGIQTITMNNPSSNTNNAYFYNVVINNSAARSSNDDITLADRLTVTNGITFTNGRMLTASTKILYLQTGATANTGSATSYVNGPMSFDVAVTGARTINLPIGEAGNWRYATLNLNHTSAATTYTYTGQVTHSSAAALGYTLPGTITHVSGVRYTTIDRTTGGPGGTSAPSAGLSGNQQITMRYSTDDQVGDYTKLTITKTTGSGSPWVDIGGTATANTTGTITSTSSPTAFTSFSKFSLANKTAGTNSLPVKLISFTAQPKGAEVKLNWQTASETNNDHFEIFRSKNGTDWQIFEEVKGAGTSTDFHNYLTTDASPFQGASYYKLKQVDFDGNSESYIMFIQMPIVSVSTYPNPAYSHVTVEAEDINLSDIKVLNQVGEDVTPYVRITQSEKAKLIIDVSGLPQQTYIVKAKNASTIIYKQ